MSEETPGDGLIAKIEAMLTRVGKPQESSHQGPVPYQRFFDANQNLKAAREGLTALTAEVAELKTTHATALQLAQEEAGKAVTKLHSHYAQNDALRDMGLDADGADELRKQWKKLPDATRPESPVDFWQTSLEAVAAHRADPETAAAPVLPRTLTAYLPAPAPVATAEPAAPAAGGGRGKGGGVVLRHNVDQGVVRGERKTKTQKVATAVANGDAGSFWGALTEKAT
jgi:hypothetical protein